MLGMNKQNLLPYLLPNDIVKKPLGGACVPDILSEKFECSDCNRVCLFERLIIGVERVREPHYDSMSPIGCKRGRQPMDRYVERIPLPLAKCTKCGQGLRVVGPTPEQLEIKIAGERRAEEREILRQQQERRAKMPDPLADLDLSKLAPRSGRRTNAMPPRTERRTK